MVSVIIAAHNEAYVLGATLDALIPEAADAQIIVAANGCTDDTAHIARSRPGVNVVELPQGGKAGALNAAEATATSFPRVLLDADIIAPPGTLGALVEALQEPGVLAAVPGRNFVTTGRPWPVRAWSTIHTRLPVFREGLFGRGMIALSQEGRARFDKFPLMVADDLFIDSLFDATEKAHLDRHAVRVEAPWSTRELLNRLIRVRRGSAAMRAAARAGDVEAVVRPADRWSFLRDVVVPEPRLAPAGLVYAAITVLAALLARRGPVTNTAWGRGTQARPVQR